MANNPKRDPQLKEWYAKMPQYKSNMSWRQWGLANPGSVGGPSRTQRGSAGMRSLQGAGPQETQWGTPERLKAVEVFKSERPRGGAITRDSMIAWGGTNPNLPRNYSKMMSGRVEGIKVPGLPNPKTALPKNPKTP